MDHARIRIAGKRSPAFHRHLLRRRLRASYARPRSQKPIAIMFRLKSISTLPTTGRQNVEKWTVTKGDGGRGYYLRITENDNPNDGAKMEINSSSRVIDERKIVDAGFLELVRLGIKAPRDPLIVESLKLIDQLIKVKTPAGDAWYRYNYDAYGETPDGGKYDARNGVGRLWTLLTGERAEYELAAGDIASARGRLDTLAGFANDGLMIPEQVWDRKRASSEFSFWCGNRIGDAVGMVHGAVYPPRDEYRARAECGDTEGRVGTLWWPRITRIKN